MATVIDQLVVKLSLDDVEFQKGEKRVAAGLIDTKKKTETVGKNIAADGKKGAEFFGQLEKAALKFFAVLTTGRGLADFTRTVIGTGAQLDRVSARMGISADTLSRWQGAVRQSGGTAEGFLATIQGLSQEMTNLAVTGQSPISKWLGFLGVSLRDTDGKIKTTEKLLADLLDAANTKIADPSQRFNILKEIGIDEGTINLGMKGKAERERLLDAQTAYSDKDAESARKAQERWEGVQLRIERITQKLVIDLIPAFERLSDKMEELANTSVPVLREIFDWIDKIDKITSKWTRSIDDLLPKFSNPTLQKLFGGYGGTAAKLNPLTNMVGGVAAGSQKLTELVNSDAVSKEDRSTIKGWSEKLLGIFGLKPKNGGAGSSGTTSKSGSASPTGVGAPNSTTGTGTTRAERNNNPGNLNYAGQTGAVLEDGSSARFAKFGSTAEGVSALAKQLQRYGDRGLDTISKIINKYAPSSENNTQAYIEALSKRLGVSGDQKLDLNDSSTLTGLIKGIARHEAGSDYLSDSDLMTGLSMAGVKGGSTQQAPNVSIGEVKVYTQATDANGIARDMRGAIIQQANTGVR